MALDVYRSCSWSEKREALGVFWHRGGVGTDRINRAALQYAPWALLCCAVVALELVFVFVGLFGRADVLAWCAVGVEVLVLASMWWAAVRYVELRSRAAR